MGGWVERLIDFRKHWRSKKMLFLCIITCSSWSLGKLAFGWEVGVSEVMVRDFPCSS